MPKRNVYIGDAEITRGGIAGYSNVAGDMEFVNVSLGVPNGWLLCDYSMVPRSAYPTITSAMIATNSATANANGVGGNYYCNTYSAPCVGKYQAMGYCTYYNGSQNGGTLAINRAVNTAPVNVFASSSVSYAGYDRARGQFYVVYNDNTTFQRWTEGNLVSGQGITLTAPIGYPPSGMWGFDRIFCTPRSIIMVSGRTGSFKTTPIATAAAAANNATLTWTTVSSNIAFGNLVSVAYNWACDAWVAVDAVAANTTYNVYRTTGDNFSGWVLVGTFPKAANAAVTISWDAYGDNEVYITCSNNGSSTAAALISYDYGQTWSSWFTNATFVYYITKFGATYWLANNSNYYSTTTPASGFGTALAWPTNYSPSGTTNAISWTRFGDRVLTALNNGAATCEYAQFPIEASFTLPNYNAWTNGATGVTFYQCLKL